MAFRNPKITRAIYDGSTVRTYWSPSTDPDVTGYVVSLFYVGQPQSDEPVYESDVVAAGGQSFAVITLDSPLNTDVSYYQTVTAMWGTETGQLSQSSVLPTAAPKLVSAYYDGSQVEFTWGPSIQSAGGYELIVLNTDSLETISVIVPDRHATSGVIPASSLPNGLDATMAWVATIGAIGENNNSARCPTAAFPNPITPPELKSSSWYREGTEILANWVPLVANNISGYRVMVSSAQNTGAQSIDLSAPTANSCTFPLKAPLLNNDVQNLQVIAFGAGGAGSISEPMQVVTTLPTVTVARYDGTTVELSWDCPWNPALTGFEMQVTAQESLTTYSEVITGGSVTSGSFNPPARLGDDQHWVAQVSAQTTGQVAAQGFRTGLPVNSIDIFTVEFINGLVSVFWAEPHVAPPSYLVELVCEGEILASTSVVGNSAVLPLSLGGPETTVQVRAQNDIGLGPISNPIVVINVAPSSFAYSSDPISGAVTLDWSAINGADGYRLSLSDGSSVQSADAYYTFDHPLDANTPMTVSVAGLTETAGVICNGPESAPFTIALQQSLMNSAEFDGQNLSAAWAPVAGASGYRLSLQKSGAPNVEEAHFDVNAEQTKGKWPFTPSDTDAVYVVGIQTVFAGNTAPISDLVNIYQPGFIPSRELASSSFPYLVPAPSMAGAYAAPTGHTIDLFLSSIGEVDAGNLPVSNGPFTFAANPDANTAPIYPYVLSMASDSAVWTFGAEPIRTELRAHYVDFLKALEDAGVVPWGLQIVQENISRYMPQTFQETLYYAFGLSFPSAATGDTLGSCDLRPGMVLRVIAEPYQSMTQNSGLQWSNGYVGGAAVDYDVQSFIDTSGNITTGFDSFVAQLVAGGAMTVNPPPEHASTQQQGGIGDAADAYYPGFRTPFYRMFNPVTLPSPSAPCPTDTTQNFVIAAADSYADLCLTRNVPGGASPVLYFRGRTVLRPCIRVILDGESRTVTVGTTVGNLLEQAGRNPMPAGLPLVGLKLWRSLGPVVLDPRASLSTQNSYQVRFDWMNEANYAPGWTALSLPLLAGDIVVTNAGQG